MALGLIKLFLVGMFRGSRKVAGLFWAFIFGVVV